MLDVYCADLVIDKKFSIQIKRDQERGIEPTIPVYTEFVRKDEEEKGSYDLVVSMFEYVDGNREISF
jgi:hypothetical protein